MSTAGRPETDAPPASDIAVTLREAGFVRLVAAGTGDAVAAMGTLARALAAVDVPYQLSVVPVPETADSETDADVTVALGRHVRRADVTLGVGNASASRTAYTVAESVGEADLALALAGIVAAGRYPDSDLLSVARDSGIDRRPGVAIPTEDVCDGLAHSTLVHAEFSGDPDRVDTVLGDVRGTDEDARRAVASAVALTVSADREAPDRGAHAVERVLRPLAGGPFRTIGGYGDVLDAVGREQPGLAVALALGELDDGTALSTWRDHAARAHEAIRTASTGRYDGLYVVKCDAGTPVGTVARLVRDFRSPERIVLAVGDGIAAATAVDDAALGDAMGAAADAVGGDGDGTSTRGRARFDGEPTAFAAALREAL